MNRKINQIVFRVLAPFQNIKLNILLFSIVAISSVIGTLLPQIPESPERVREFLLGHPSIGNWLLNLGFFNVYTSRWFVGFLALLAFNVIVCKLIFGKFPGLSVFKKSEETAFPAGAFQAEWEVGITDFAKENLTHALQTQGYRVYSAVDQSGEFWVLAARHAWQRWGSWVAHVAIVLVLLGSLISALYGFKESVMIPEGSSAQLKYRPWTLHVDRFTVDFYEGTQTPSQFTSDIRLSKEGEELAAKKIQVNYPLEHEGVRFYQASYTPSLKSARVGVFLRDRPKESQSFWLHPDEDVPVPGTDYSVRILNYVPDLTIGPDGKVSSKSANPNNPGLRLLISEKGKPQRAVWIFANFPTMQMPPLTDTDRLIFIFAGFEQNFSSGIQVARDPGAPIFWAACTILVLALMLLFYLHLRKVWVRLVFSADSVRVQVAALSSRGKGFEEEFQALVQTLKSA